MGDGLAAACLGRKEPGVTTYVGKNFVFRRVLGGLDSDLRQREHLFKNWQRQRQNTGSFRCAATLGLLSMG
jgi:hypothetical protein